MKKAGMNLGPENDKRRAAITQGDKWTNAPLRPRAALHQPPPRYTEADIGQTDEELGIVRRVDLTPELSPTIQDREYVRKEANRLSRDKGRFWHRISSRIISANTFGLDLTRDLRRQL